MNIDVVGIGNAIVDVLVQVEDDFLIKNKLKKGSMSLISGEEADNLYKSINKGLESSGGSAANTLAAISDLGGSSAFIGRVRNDNLGKTFTNELRNTGTAFETSPSIEGPSTARCIVFVTPDAQRTMCTYLGASVFLDSKDLNSNLIKQAKVLYLEGYLFDNPEAKEAFINAATIIKRSKGKVALSLSDSFCVERHRDSFINLINDHIDILFANEDEIMSLYKTSNIKDATSRIKDICEINAITLGSQGSLILSKDQEYKVSPYNLGNLVDTTGAGDIYAGGFLYGYTQGKNLLDCGRIGSLCAGLIVTQLGSRSKESLNSLLEENTDFNL